MVAAAPAHAQPGRGEAAGPPVLALHQVRCRLGGAEVVRGVSLQLTPGERACLLGPSGCGKTTLLRAIAGFQALEAGSIALRGIECSGPGVMLAPERRRIGFVFQDLALFPHLDVQANVAFGLQALARPARPERVHATLARLGIAELARRYPHELSGGQQQRVALARALAPQPDLLLLDEPFSSLDAHLRTRLREELRALLDQLGIAALLVTHDQDEAFAFADRIGVMRSGALEQWATGYDIYHRPATSFVARFVGEGRFLRGVVTASGGVSTTLGRFRAGAGLPFPEGREVQVLIRPDDLRPDGERGIPAEVVAASFRGAETLYTLRLSDGEEVHALFPSHIEHAVGSRVHVALDLEHVVVFEQDAGAAGTGPWHP